MAKKTAKAKIGAAAIGERAARIAAGARAEDRMTREERVARGRTDYEWFCRYYLAHYFTSPGCPFHRELFEIGFTVDRFVGAAPRGHAKSTIISFARPIHAAVYELAHFIVLFRSTDGEAESAVDDIRKEFEENERLREDFGDLVGDRKWTGSVFITASNIKIEGRGRGRSSRGLKHQAERPDLAILDDIEDDEEVESKEQRDKLERWIKRVVLGLFGSDGGKFFMVGTVMHHDAVLVRLLKMTNVFVTRIWRAIQDDGKPLWPAAWTLKKLEAKREEIGARNFATEFMNNPANEEEQIFSGEYVRRFTDADLAGVKLDEAAAIDPAIGQKARNDNTGIVVAGTTNGNYYILRVRLKKLKIQAQVEAVFATYREFPRLLKFGFETVAYQSALKQLVDEENQRLNLQMPAVAVDDQSSDKLKRISTLAPLWEQGRIWWPHPNSSYWTPDVERCIEEFEALGCSTDSHDDGPDATERVIKLLRGKLGGKKGKVSLL